MCDGSVSSSPVIPPICKQWTPSPFPPADICPGTCRSFASRFLSLETGLQCWASGVGPHYALRICSGRAFAGLFQDFLIVTTCLGDCDALSSSRTQSSWNHAPSTRPRASRPRLLTQPCSITVGDCSHGTFHNHLKTLRARANLHSPESLLISILEEHPGWPWWINC